MLEEIRNCDPWHDPFQNENIRTQKLRITELKESKKHYYLKFPFTKEEILHPLGEGDVVLVSEPGFYKLQIKTSQKIYVECKEEYSFYRKKSGLIITAVLPAAARIRFYFRKRNFSKETHNTEIIISRGDHWERFQELYMPLEKEMVFLSEQDRISYEYEKLGICDKKNFYFNIDTKKMCPNSPHLPLCYTNLADRGIGFVHNEQGLPLEVNNQLKYMYMSAFSYNKLFYYTPKIQKHLSLFYTEIATHRKPVCSSFQDSLVKFFLDLHLGKIEPLLYEYFAGYLNLNEDPLQYIRGNIQSTKIRAFILNHCEEIQFFPKDVRKETTMYWWLKEGMSADRIAMEILSGIKQFSLFNHVLHKLITKLVYFEEYRKIVSKNGKEEEKINLIREFFRLELPEEYSISHKNNIQYLHSHRDIMKNNDEDYEKMDTSVEGRYKNYPCKFTEKRPDHVMSFFYPSEQDKETLLDMTSLDAANFCPMGNYWPFSVGYRRCPLEIFSYLFTQRLVEMLYMLSFEENIAPQSCPYVGKYENNIFVVR